MKTSIRLLAAASLALASQYTLAWGQEGHRITGYVAEQLLTDAARKQLATLIPNADLAELSLYMDQNKQKLKQELPGSDQWHYDDRPVCGGEGGDTCPQGNCASNKIAHYSKVLADAKAPRADRAQALTFLVHMVGDIHQPLHAADNHDRGGNDVKVKLDGKSYNLHSVWDTQLVRKVMGSRSEWQWAQDAVQAQRSKITGWQTGRVEDWIIESNALAQREVYAPLEGFSCGQPQQDVVYLDRNYVNTGKVLVNEQLVKAGARVAAVINQALR